MGFFDMFIPKDINAEYAKACEDKGSVILDVRTVSEYRGGHIPKSVNIPVDEIEKAFSKYDKATHLYVYCLSGARSASAVRALKNQGYEHVVDMGGIGRYQGQIER